MPRPRRPTPRPGASGTDPLGYYAVNLTGTLNLLHALEATSSRRPVAVVLGSTGAVHGSLDEAQPVLPGNPYAASKLAAEHVLAAASGAGLVGGITLRCFNIGGAVAGTTDPDPTRMIPRTLAVAAGHAAELSINGDGGSVRDYTHVLDVARAYRLALAAAVPGRHRVYSIGSGRPISLMDLVRTAREVTGRAIPVVHRPAQPEPRVLVADSTRARRELGWKPELSDLTGILRDSWAAVTER